MTNLGESLHISNVIYSTKMNSSFDTCFFFFWSAKTILPKRECKGEMRREAGRRGEGAKKGRRKRREGDVFVT